MAERGAINMQNEDLQKTLDELNDKVELKQKYMQAATAEEKGIYLLSLQAFHRGASRS